MRQRTVIPPVQPQQVPVQPAKKTPNRHPKGKKPAKPTAVSTGKGGIAAGKGVNIARLRATVRSGVTFPIPAIYRRLRMLGYRVSRKSAVFLAAALEYLTAEVLDLAGGETKRMKRVRIQPTDLREALKDDELAKLTMDVVLPGAGNVTNNPE